MLHPVPLSVWSTWSKNLELLNPLWVGNSEQEKKERPMTAMTQLNIIPLLADMAVLLNKVDVVNIILPLFIESLEVGDASSPGLVRLRVCWKIWLQIQRMPFLQVSCCHSDGMYHICCGAE